MKLAVVFLFAILSSLGAVAADANLFVGGVNAGVAGGSLAGSTSQSGAALIGLAATSGQASTAQGAIAGGVVGPNGVAVYQFGGATGESQTAAGALGLAGGGSQATGGSGNLTGAEGFFRTIGIQVNPVVNPQ